jgi:hypothetical protein
MQSQHKTILFAWSVALLLASTSAPALTLGRLHGSVLLGKALDVSVSVQSAADEDLSAICFDADVIYGEIPLERSRITIQSLAGAQPNSRTVQISSPVPVNEAVVTINLKASCGPKAARRYVLLSEVISETISSGADTTPVSMPTPMHTQSTTVQAVAPAPGADQVASPVVVKPSLAAKKAPVARPKQAPVAKGSANDAEVSAGKPLNTPLIEELQRRVDEMEKAQGSNSVSEQLLKNASLAKALEADIESLRVATVKNQKNLQTMVAALESAPTQNYGRGLVYLLGALLLACVAALAYIVMRLRNAGFDTSPWWSGGEDRSATTVRSASAVPAPLMSVARVDADTANLAVTSTRAMSGGNTAPASMQSQPIALDADTTRNTVVMDVRPVTSSSDTASAISPRAPNQDFANSNTGAIKTINTKEMLDIRQQAEFFMALGQHDEAVRLLESNIQDSADANPLIFLDLLKILHTLSRRVEFERYREEFNLQFTGRVLDYANFRFEGNGLEAYEDICQQIVVLWPSEYTIDYIEQCLVRTPEDDPEQGIDLEAFKDLLLLYGVLRRLDQTDEAYLPFSTSRTAHSSSTEVNGGFGHAEEEGDISPPLPEIDSDSQAADIDLDIGVDLDLDIDLDVSEVMANAEKKPNNLIDFDMPEFVRPAPGKPGKP